jgi:hypothetical protein
MADLGWTAERVSQGFEELSRNGFAYRYEGVVLLPGFLRWNKVANANVASARMAEFDALPKGEARAHAAVQILKYAKHLSNDARTVLQTVAQTLSGTVTQTEPYQTQPRENPTKEESSLRSDLQSPGEAGDLLGDATEAGNVHQHPAERITSLVLAAYHELLPHCQRIAVVNPKRQRRIQLADKLARQVCRNQGWTYDAGAFWAAYFGQCAEDPWLRGEVANPKNPRWKQNLDVLIAEDRFAQIMDQAVTRLETAA